MFQCSSTINIYRFNISKPVNLKQQIIYRNNYFTEMERLKQTITPNVNVFQLRISLDWDMMASVRPGFRFVSFRSPGVH